MKNHCQQIYQSLDQIKNEYRLLKAISDPEQLLSRKRRAEALVVQDKINVLLEKIKTFLALVAIDRAHELLDQPNEINVLGPKQLKAIFGINLNPEDIPLIPFSIEELERAKAMDQILILRVDKTADGKPLSLQAMVDIIQPRWDKEDKGRLLWTVDNYQDWQERTGNDWKLKPPRAGWALVSKELLPESTDKNYIDQTTGIIKVLRGQIFKDIPMPQEYTEAIEAFQSNRDRLTRLMNEDPKQAAKELSKLKITQLTRQTVQEAVYDFTIYFEANNKRLLPTLYTWTASLNPDVDLVDLGYFNREGMGGGAWMPASCHSKMGVSLSRRL